MDDEIDGLGDALLKAAFERSGREADPPLPERTRGGRLFGGRYHVGQEIGRGGQGTVHESEDVALGRRVAVKLLTGFTGVSQDTLSRFEREARLASRLQHPAICAVHDAGVEDGVPFIVMQWVEGTTLAALIERARRDRSVARSTSGALTEAEASGGVDSRTLPDTTGVVPLIEAAARALHVAHEAGVIHRDIKPGNIMVSPSGDPVLLDFGLARDTCAESPSLTREGEVLGTPAYMSPEQLMGKEIRMDRRADVYGLGVTLFEALTLRHPFQAATREALYRKILGEDPPDPRLWNPGITKDLKTILDTALEKVRDRRYQTALDLAEDLRRLREHRSIRARPPTPLARLSKVVRRNPLSTSLALLLVGSLMAGLVVSLQALGREREAVVRVRRSEAAAQGLVDAYEQLADMRRLDALRDEARHALWPPVPEKIQAMEDWLARAKPLVEGLPKHRGVLEELREQARPRPLEIPRSDALDEDDAYSGLASRLADLERILSSDDGAKDPEERRLLEQDRATTITLIADGQVPLATAAKSPWVFADDRIQWRHDLEAQYVQEMERFLGPDVHGETLRSVEWRLETAASLRTRTIDLARDAWDRARKETSEEGRYGGLQLIPQLGLVPLGQDRQTGLQEFAHVLSGSVPERDPETGDLRLTEEMGLILVLLPGGAFFMGAQGVDPTGPNFEREAEAKDSPVHRVALEPFFISKYEMTQAQWIRATGHNPSQFTIGFLPDPGRVVTGRHPVEQVNFLDCFQTLARLALCLPTEAQWEYACRGGTQTRWWTGSEESTLEGAANLADKAAVRWGASWPWLKNRTLWDDGYGPHAPVGSFRANPFGLHDVHGNVLEWCLDPFAPYEDPLRGGDGLRLRSQVWLNYVSHRVTRGGAYQDMPRYLRSSMHHGVNRTIRSPTTGVRPARRLDRP